MKLKRTLVSAFAGLALVASLGASVALAQDTNTGTTDVSEGGTFGAYGMWGTSLGFGTATVDTENGDTLTIAGQVFDLNDSRASSPGWTIQMTATNFSDGEGHLVENKYLSLSGSAFNPFLNNCVGYVPEQVPTNPFQQVTLGTTPATLDSAVTVVQADAGRGCGYVWINLDFELEIPAGTYTGGDSTQYTSQVTVSEVGAPGI